jgi:DNA-binding SARP family transcriptional activator/pimeloyl-ACP methyl ester carboxylesterase
MEFRLLGPLEAREGAAPVALGARKQRALLARLLLDANHTVSIDRLVDDLWGEDVPESAVKMVQIYVSQLRKLLPGRLLVTRAPGYLVELDPEALDLVRFRRMHEEGREMLARGDAPAAAARLREALALWRGPALAEFSEAFAAVEAAHLEELRLACLEDRVDADLRRGSDGALVGELESLVARYPLRERLRSQHMLALYRAGRESEALAAYQRYRRTLDEQLGIEPSQRLKDLERQMLQQDRELDLEPANAPPLLSAPVLGADVRYVQSGDVSIAYQVVGEGPLDLVLVHGWVCGFHAGWEYEPLARFYRRLASLGRLILFDKRGTGLSDRVTGIAPLEERIDDVRAVMDAVGSERAALLGISEGGPMVTLFAASHPERTRALVAMGTFARRTPAPDYPINVPTLAVSPDEWGLPIARRWVSERAPSVARDEEAVRWYSSYFTRGASPGAAIALRSMNDEIDVRSVLPTIHVPTLVLYRSHEYLREATRYMGERIPHARVVELPGADHVPWEGDQDAVLAEIERFLTVAATDPEPDRILTTVVCITGLAPGHPDLARIHEHLPRFRGTPLEVTEGSVLASFDGPARAIRCAWALVRGREIQAGMHTGECEVTAAGVDGTPVELARAVAAHANPGEVLVSATVRDLVAGAGLTFTEYGSVRLQARGEAREWTLLSAMA